MTFLLLARFANDAFCQGNIVYPIRNKDTSTVDFTSFKVKTGNAPTTTVTVPSSWVATREGTTSFWVITGDALAPGGTLNVNVTNTAGNARVQGVSGDYRDDEGNARWVTICSDPISATVISGGSIGDTYMGYSIPPNEFGYFYQMWNVSDFSDQTKSADIRIGRSSGAHTFEVIANTFEINPVDGFDLQDLEVWSAVPENTIFEVQQYMEEEEALGVSGIDTDWEFDAATGVATMTFLPSDPLRGLGPGQTGSIVAYTSPLPPGNFSEVPNVFNVEFLGDFTCPNDFCLVPMPEPSTVALFILGLVCLIADRRMSSRRSLFQPRQS